MGSWGISPLCSRLRRCRRRRQLASLCRKILEAVACNGSKGRHLGPCSINSQRCEAIWHGLLIRLSMRTSQIQELRTFQTYDDCTCLTTIMAGTLEVGNELGAYEVTVSQSHFTSPLSLLSVWKFDWNLVIENINNCDRWNFVIENNLQAGHLGPCSIYSHWCKIIEFVRYGMAYEFACQLEPVRFRDEAFFLTNDCTCLAIIVECECFWRLPLHYVHLSWCCSVLLNAEYCS